jgi:putative Ca2+/H+ antiporter (TMEM165/GDT1 family)
LIEFWQSLGLIAVAEMGDKSQLVALAFATRYRPIVVLLGVSIATLTVHLGSVFLGRAIDSVLPDDAITAAAGLAFIAFGAWTLRGDSLIGVWLGSTVGMVLADAVAIVVGMAMGKRIPARTVKLGAAGIFLVTGLVTLATLL